MPDMQTAIRTFLAAGDPESAVRILLDTRIVWVRVGRFRDAAAIFSAVDRALLAPATAAEMDVIDAVVAGILGADDAVERLEVAVREERRFAPASVALVTGLCHLAARLAEDGRHDEAVLVADEAVDVARHSGDHGSEGMALDLASYVALLADDRPRAVAASAAAVRVARASGSGQLRMALAAHASALEAAGRLDEALAIADEVLNFSDGGGVAIQQEAELQKMLGRLVSRRDPGRGASLLASAVATLLALGSGRSALEAMAKLASVGSEAGVDPAAIARLLGAIESRLDEPAAASLDDVRAAISAHLSPPTFAAARAGGMALGDDAVARDAAAIATAVMGAEPHAGL
jgi:tetratricopeptide (TPR) repeat protein